MGEITGSATWRPAGHWQTHDGERLYTEAECREREKAAYVAAYVLGALYGNSTAHVAKREGEIEADSYLVRRYGEGRGTR